MTESTDNALPLEDCLELLDDLPLMTLDGQLEALERLLAVSHPEVRKRVLGLGAAIFSDERLVDYLRDGADDVRRNAGVEMLKLRRRRALDLASALLDDPDPDVALQAVLVLGHLRDLRGLEPLRRALRHDDPNVVQEAIVALGELRLPAAIGDLEGLIDGDPWLAAAAIEALGKLGAADAVPRLAERLADPLLGAFAAEALTRIGGRRAFVALADHWRAHPDVPGTALMLALMARVLERMSTVPPSAPGLEPALLARREDPDPRVRRAALQCLLVLRGPDRLAP